MNQSKAKRCEDELCLGTALSPGAHKMLLLGSGELGKEVAIEAQRLGVEVIAADRYARAPAMHIAHRSHVIDMLDGEAIRQVVESERPDWIVPEIEAIHTETLLALEKEGWNVVPTARATRLTMDREGIRRLVAETLSLPTSPYRFAETLEDYRTAVEAIGLPCVVKPVMSSSGKGQSVIRQPGEMDAAWQYAQAGGRAGAGRVIVEGFVDFDYEITLLTVRHRGGTSFCAPIGHRQEGGDYRESWQPQAMSDRALSSAREIAERVSAELGGWGVFGMEFFIRGDEAIFSEVSPRPHDTGLVTLVSQDLSEFALHVRAIMGLPIPLIEQFGPSASAAFLPAGEGEDLYYRGLEAALAEPQTQLRLFAKPDIQGQRRMGVSLARSNALDDAVDKARRVCDALRIATKD
ncbi:MAG: formate-dependent phosphoribosylglycinamide formyltransferase [Pseudomonadota bacterium]